MSLFYLFKKQNHKERKKKQKQNKSCSQDKLPRFRPSPCLTLHLLSLSVSHTLTLTLSVSISISLNSSVSLTHTHLHMHWILPEPLRPQVSLWSGTLHMLSPLSPKMVSCHPFSSSLLLSFRFSLKCHFLNAPGKLSWLPQKVKDHIAHSVTPCTSLLYTYDA